MPDAEPFQVESDESQGVLTVLVALAANLGVAIAKLVAGLLSRSSAMLAEAVHAFADTGNEVLLLVAQRRSVRPADQMHPFGHGREAYFWALIASMAVFVTGALLSIREGVLELIHPTKVTSFAVAYAVLGVSFALETVSLRRAFLQLRREAASLSREFFDHFELSSDPIGRAVFAEDAAALVGNVIAAIGIALHQITGSPIPDASAAILIGLVLGYVALQLARRNGDFLIGRRAPAVVHQRIEATLAAAAGVRAVSELFVTFLGPRRLWVIARIDIDDQLTGAGVKALIKSLERALIRQSPFVARVDIVPAARS